MADQLLERLSKEDGVTVTPVTPMPAQIPSPKNEAEVNQFKSIISSPGFYKSPPDQQRAKIRQIPSFSQVPDADLDKFIGTDVRSIVDNKPGLLRTFWEDLNSPVKAFTGKSLKERFDETAQDYATGATGKLMQEAAAADRAIKNAGFGGDDAVTPILQANATPEGRRFTHALTSEAIGLAESPLTYVGLGESAVTGPGAARLVAKIGDAGNIAKEAFAATPVIAKAAGKAGEVAAKGLKGVQTAQLWGTRAFQAQALAGAATSVNNYVKDPTPENAASAIFGVGLGGMVASHLARNTKANYDAGAEAVRIMERARDLAWHSGSMRLHDLPGAAQAEYIKQAASDVFAGVSETKASTLPGKVKAARDKAWRLARTSPVTPESMAAELTPQSAAAAPQPQQPAAARPPVATPAEAPAATVSQELQPIYTINPPVTDLQPVSNFEANQPPNFQRPGEWPAARTQRPPLLSGNVQSDVYNQPQGDYQDPRALAAGQPGGQVPMLRERGGALEPQYTVNPPVTDLQPASNFEANPEQFTRPINEYPPIRNYGQQQIQGTATPPAFVMPGRGAQGPIPTAQSAATPVVTPATPVVTPQGATPRPPSISQQAPMENLEPSPMPQAALPLDPPKRQAGGGHQIVLGAPTRFEVVSQNGPDYMVSGHFAVVPRASVLASHDTTFNETPGFPKEIQPRKRDRAAGQAQVEEIANLLSLHKIAGHPEATGGAPIMNPEDFALEGGNGRMIGVNLAYERGGPQAEKYRNDLIERAAEFGLDPAYVASIQDPVLVRVRSGELPKGVSRRQFAIDTNAPSTGGMSALENATNDRQHLTPEVMALYRPDQELGSAGNADFVLDFFKYAVNKNDRGKLQNKNGRINSDGIKRIGNAIFARAYGDNSLLESMSESTDPDVKNVIKALVDSAPEMIRLDDAIAAGERHPVSISEDIAWAGNQLAQLKRQGIPLKDYFKQGDFLNAPPTPMQTDLLVMIDGFNRSGTKIADVLAKYIEAVHAAGDPRQVGMFEQGDPPKPQDVLEAAVQRVKEAAASKKSAILGEEGKNVPEAQQAGPGEGGEDSGSVAIGGQSPAELGEAAAKSIQSSSDQPAASKKVAAKPKSEAAPAEKPPASEPAEEKSLVAEMMDEFKAFWDAEKNSPKDEPLRARGESDKPDPLAALAFTLPPEAREAWGQFTQFFRSKLEAQLKKTGGVELSDKRRGEIAQLYPDLAKQYIKSGAVDEKAPAKEVIKAAENQPAAVDAVSSGGIGTEVEPASGKVEPDNGRVAEYDGLRSDNNGNVGRDGSAGDQPNGETPRPPVDFENKRIISAGERMIPPSDTSVIPPEIAKYLKPQQLTGAADAISAMNGPETGFLIADGCVAGETRLLDPITGQWTAIQDLYLRGEPITVLSLTKDGMRPAKATAPFLKGVAKLYRVTMDGGQQITVTGEHRFLTVGGWRTIKAGLSQGMIVASSWPHSYSSPAIYSDAHQGSVESCSQKPEDCLGRYWTYRHHDDAQPLADSGNDREQLPSSGGAPGCTQKQSGMGASEPSRARIRPRQSSGHPSRSNFAPSSSLGPSVTSLPAPSASAQSPGAISLAWQQSPTAPVSLRSSVPSVAIRQSPLDVIVTTHTSTLKPHPAWRYMRKQSAMSPRIGRKAARLMPHAHKRQVSLPAQNPGSSACNYNSGWNRVVSIEFHREDVFYDLHVPGTENYVAEGIINHNTGAGKSLMSLTVAKHFANKGFSVLIVSKAEAFKFDYDTRQPTGTYARWSKTFGIPLEGYVGPERDNFVTKLEPGKVYAATYDTVFGLAPRENPKKPGVFSKGSPGIAHLVGPNTVLIMDEAHAAKNSGGGAENRANASVDMANRAGKVLMMTATPGDKPAHVQYLQRVGLLEGKSQDQQLSELGFKKKVTKGKDGKEVVTWNIDPQVGKRTVRTRLDALFSRLMANGQMVKREISMDGVDIQMAPISLPEEGYEIMDMIENRLSDGAGLKNVDGLQKAVILGHMRRAQEGYKIPHIVNMVKEELAEGRKVIIVIELVNDSPVIKRTKVMTPHGIETQEEVIHVNKSTAQALKQALFDIGLVPADIAEIHGGAKESSIEAVERFQNGSARVAIITGPSGGTGIDLDDQKGNAARTMIIATPPFEGTANTQLIGREWRLGTKSSPRVRYVFADTETDYWNMRILADKMKTLGVIVKGEAKGAMDFANIQGGEIRPGFVPEGEFIEDDDAADAPAGAAPKALKGKGGKELPPPVEGGWLELEKDKAKTYKNREKLGRRGIGGYFQRYDTTWHVPDTLENRQAVLEMGLRIKGLSTYRPAGQAINQKEADAANPKSAVEAEPSPEVIIGGRGEPKFNPNAVAAKPIFGRPNLDWREGRQAPEQQPKLNARDGLMSFRQRKQALARGIENLVDDYDLMRDIQDVYLAKSKREAAADAVAEAQSIKSAIRSGASKNEIELRREALKNFVQKNLPDEVGWLLEGVGAEAPQSDAPPARAPQNPAIAALLSGRSGQLPNLGEAPKLSPKAKAEAGRQRIRDFYRPGNLVTSYGGGNDRVLAFKENPDGTWDVDVQEEKNGKLINRPRRHSTPPDKYDKIIESAPGEAPKPPAKLAFGGAKNSQDRQLATPRPPMFSDPEDEPLRARERKLSTKRPPASFIEKAVNDQGKATMGADIRALAEDLGSSLYKGQDTAVVAKELLQNAMDATRLLGAGVAGEVSVEIDKVNRIIRVTDNGTGMSKSDLGTVFVDLGASGKRDQDGASGGFGLAKAAPLMMGKSITVRSIHRSPSGELIESGMTTNKEELLGSGATIWSKPAPRGSSTGTSVEVTMPHSDWNPWFEAEQFAKRSLKSIRPPAALKVTVGDGRVVKTKADDSVARETMKPATQLSVTGATADIFFSPEKKGLDLSSAYSVSIEINNNGIFQFETSIYLGQSASLKGMPAVIAVDVKATVKEGHKDYPFTANREALRSDDLTDQIKKYVQDTIIAPAIKDATDFIQHKYDSLQEISRGVVLFDSGARLTSGEIEWLQDDPDFSNLASVLNKVTANALYAISQSAEIAGRRNLLGLGSGIERAGIVLSKELHGVHITNPKTGKATIFSNPLSFTEGTSPIKAASLIWHTIKHEILHDKVKGHSEEFTVGLTKVDEALGDSFMDSLSELRDAYADKNDKSKFRSGIIEALRIYAASRGRPERERDPFRGEASRIGKPAPGGIRGTPANVSGGGKAAIREVGGAQSGGSRSDGKRTARPPVGVDPEDTPAYAREPDIKWEPGKPLAELKADTPASRRSRGEVATYLNKQVRKSLGGLSASAGEKAKIARLMNLGRIEIADQIAQKNNGAGFYSKDTPLADADMIRAFPELAEPRKLAFQKALSAVLANNQDPDAEAYVGAQVYDQFRKTGVIPATRPNGTPWPGRGSLEQMQKLERMRKAMGVDGLVAFLTAPQRLSEIPKWRPSVYVSKAKADTYVPGFLVLGDKIGPYWGELMQLRGQESTPIDRWDAAGQYRRMGRLIEGGKPKDAPDNEDDRQIFMRSHGELAKEFGLDRPGTAQSLLWHYEKALYSALGSPSKAGKRSDGTARYLGERGIANERGTELPADDRSANNDRADRVGEAEGRQGKGNDGGVGKARGEAGGSVPAKRTARPPVGDPEDTPLLARAPGPVWYSQLQKAIESKAMPAKAPADQIRAILRNPNSGVKADEVKWSGLDDWLSEQKGAITKEQVLDYLKQNNVVVSEVGYGGARNPKQTQMMERIREINDALIYGTDDQRRVLWDERKELQDALTGPIEGSEPTKFSDYKTPGGKDYGELLMTVPERVTPLKWEAAPEVGDDTIKSSDGRYEIYDLSARGKGFKVYDKASSVSVIPRGVADSGYATLAEAKAGAARHSAKDTGTEKNFQSTHWDPKNVIAHLRYETRTGPDKQKHFLMVENQSDWGQKGSKQGFRDEKDPKFSKLKKDLDKIREEEKSIRGELKYVLDEGSAKRKNTPSPYETTQKFHAAMDEIRPLLAAEDNLGFGEGATMGGNMAMRAIIDNPDFAERWNVSEGLARAGEKLRAAKAAFALVDEAEKTHADPRLKQLNAKLTDLNAEKNKISAAMNKLVPPMPFADTWHELVIRRALRHAVENGFDRFSWEEGAVHADRYSLSKVASKVAWKPVEGEEFEKLGAGYITAYDHSGNQVYNQYTKADELPKHIGEGASEALLAAPKNADGIHELTGEGLRAGDQWPTKFYDKKIPGYVKRLAGKFGSVLEKAEIELPATAPKYEGKQYTLAELEGLFKAARADEDDPFREELRRLEYAMTEGDGNTFADSIVDVLGSLSRNERARFLKFLGGELVTSPATATVWSIPITEEMRDSVMQGQPLFQKTKRPPSMGLFEAADDTELAKQDKERLLGQRLTAQFNSEISMQENLSKLKKKPFVQQQHSFFEALPDDDQTSLFLRGMNTPVKIGLDGKPDTASAIRDAKIRIYAKGGNRAARVYLNPAAHQIIMKAEIEAGVAKPGNPWLGAAMKPVWMYRIVDEMRSTGKLGSKVNDAELMRKMDELADQLEDAVRDSLNPMSVSLIAADGAKQDVEAVARHEQQHADQYAVEPKSNFKPAELFGQQNLLKIETNKNYQKAGEGLMSAGYPYKSLPTEVMSHVVDGRLDKDGNVMTLGVTPEEGLNLYVDLLEAAVATKGRIAYTLVQNAARPTKQTIRQIRRSRDSRSVQRPNQGGAERGADQQSPRAGRSDGGNSGRSQDIPRTKRPPG